MSFSRQISPKKYRWSYTALFQKLQCLLLIFDWNYKAFLSLKSDCPLKILYIDFSKASSTLNLNLVSSNSRFSLLKPNDSLIKGCWSRKIELCPNHLALCHLIINQITKNHLRKTPKKVTEQKENFFQVN